jgi:formylglycine-generating enzyme required for sulfatase activity
MGSPPAEVGHEANETQHMVTITRGYCMKATEVTQGEWQSAMNNNPSRFKGCGANCPVEMVSWNDAVAYANALSRREGLAECYSGYVGASFLGLTCTGYRLPTEAEWEYAARAGTTGTAHGQLDSVAWYADNSGNQAHWVGQKLPNAWGLYDMLGNVWEWTGDWYDEYLGSVKDPMGDWIDVYPGVGSDPTGDARGTLRVYRGGSWYGVDRGARAANRVGAVPATRSSSLGFRLVRTAP